MSKNKISRTLLPAKDREGESSLVAEPAKEVRRNVSVACTECQEKKTVFPRLDDRADIKSSKNCSLCLQSKLPCLESRDPTNIPLAVSDKDPATFLVKAGISPGEEAALRYNTKYYLFVKTPGNTLPNNVICVLLLGFLLALRPQKANLPS